MAKERLGGAVLAEDGEPSAESVDVALATNMISVGLDIQRLGLMVVQGQPKTAAEYIQATSWVGRERDKPGLVVTLLNLHKPRDRTHYEQFRAFHASFYRAVEPTSVTPFAPRALDRALAAVVVAVARHVSPDLSASDAVARLQDHPEVREQVILVIARRAASAGLSDEAIDGVVGRTSALLRSWVEVAEEQTATGSGFTYDGPGAQSRLLQRPLDPDSNTLPDAHRQFEAGRSMRDVEHGVLLKAADPNGRPLN